MITETDFYKKIVKPWFNIYGRTERIENSVLSGFPDVVYGAVQKVMFVELKIKHVNKIKLEKYQIPMASRMANYISPNLYWFACWTEAGVEMYRWVDIQMCTQSPLRGEGVSVALDEIKPTYMIFHPDHVKDWLVKFVQE